MKCQTTFVFACVVLAPLFFAGQVRADSDGSYCTSRGYLAYELREGLSPEVKGHVVRVLRFAAERGIYTAGELTLPDFQVHQMYCTEDRVEVWGWNKGFHKYIIDTKGPEAPRIAGHFEDAARKFVYTKEPPDTSQLWYVQPGAIPLESPDPGHKYQLLLSHSQKTVKEGLEDLRKAELLQLDLKGKILRRVFLCERRSTEGGE